MACTPPGRYLALSRYACRILMSSVRATSCSVKRPSIHFSRTIARFSSLFVKVICSFPILTFSRNSYTLTKSQNNDTRKKERLPIARRYAKMLVLSVRMFGPARAATGGVGNANFVSRAADHRLLGTDRGRSAAEGQERRAVGRDYRRRRAPVRETEGARSRPVLVPADHGTGRRVHHPVPCRFLHRQGMTAKGGRSAGARGGKTTERKP